MNRGGRLAETEGRGRERERERKRERERERQRERESASEKKREREREREGRQCLTCPVASGSFAHSSSLMGGPRHGLTHPNPLDFQSDPCKARVIQAY